MMEAQVQAKRVYNRLNEIMDLSKQLAEAIDRNDQVCVRMLVTMRQPPINQVKEADMALEQQCDGLPDPDDRRRLKELLQGSAAQTPDEGPLAEQIAANARLLEQVLRLDKSLSKKLAREKSIYDSTK